MNNCCGINIHVVFGGRFKLSPSGTCDDLLMLTALSKPSVLHRGSWALEQPQGFWAVPPVSPRKAFAGRGDLVRETDSNIP